MKNKLFLFVFVIAAAMAAGASAAGIFDITFPIAELGGCADQAACKVYCDDAANQQVCTQFAADHGFVSKENATHSQQITQKIKDAGGGPGGCADENACRAYCADQAHLDECVAFGEQHGLIDQKNLQQIRKSGLISGPGGCQGADACRSYCDDAAHQQTCVDWAEQNGVITKDQAAQAKKIAGRTGPGGCTGDQCREYCADASHTEECVAFAEKNNLISSADAARAKKFIAAAQQVGPGGCTGTQCREYCGDPNHHDECFAFAKKNGLITQDQAKQFEAGKNIEQTVRQSGGPGGCKDTNTCKDYCTDPAHVEECVAFASAHGGVSTDQAQQMVSEFTRQKTLINGDVNALEDLEQFQQDAEQKFQQFKQLETQFRGAGMMPPPSRSVPGQEPGRPAPHNQQGGDQNGSPADGETSRQTEGFTGPGGCASPAECIKYCSEHTDVCFSSVPVSGSGDQNNAGSPNQGARQGLPPPGQMLRLRNDLIRPFQSQPQRGNAEGQEESDANAQESAPRPEGGIPGVPPRMRPSQGTDMNAQPGSGGASGRNNTETPGTGSGATNRFPNQRPQNGFPGIRQNMNQRPSGMPFGGPGTGSGGQNSFFRGSQGQFPPAGGGPANAGTGEFPGGQFPPGANTGGMNGAPPTGAGSFGAGAPGGSFGPSMESGESGGTGSFGGSPPSSGGSPPPPSSGGGLPPPPPSGFAPISNFFSAIVQSIIR